MLNSTKESEQKSPLFNKDSRGTDHSSLCVHKNYNFGILRYLDSHI